MSMRGFRFLGGFTRRERTLFFLTASFILAVVLYILVFEPVYTKWAEMVTEFESSNARLFKSMKLLADKDFLEAEHDRYKDYIQRAGDEQEEVPSILKEIETIALRSGVKITSIKPKNIKRFKNYKKFRIEVVSEAEINQFLKFIYDLEGSKRLLKVERLVLTLKGRQSTLLKGTFVIHKIAFVS